MKETMKVYVSQQEKEHRKNLVMLRIFSEIHEFGENIFGMSEFPGIKRKIQGCIYVYFLICYILIFGFVWGIVGLTVSKWCVKKFGEKMCVVYERRLEKIRETCQKLLDDFTNELYKEYRIKRGQYEDEICEDSNFIMKSGCFEADFQSNCEGIHIYCLNDKNTKNQYKDNSSEEGYISMKKNIPSVEFNKKFGVVIPKKDERDCMKFLSPSRQLSMVRSNAFKGINELYIANGKLKATTNENFGRPLGFILIHSFSPILENFVEIESYCKKMRSAADCFKNSYCEISKMLDVA